MKPIKLTLLSSSLLVIALNSLSLQAENVVYSRDEPPPSAEEIGRILFAPSTRSIDVHKVSSGAKVLKSAKNESSSVGLPIEFAFNSDAIQPESIAFIDEIGKAMLSSEYKGKRLIIEGHTDAAGTDNYNLALSQRRARAVGHYLSKKFNIASTRLSSRGLGEKKPLPDHSPDASENRRVQFYKAG